MALLSYALLLALPAAEGSGSPVIHHDAVDCMVADAFPRLEARIDPDDDVSRARLRFHREDDKRWYSVMMFRREGVWSAVLPKPKAGAQQVRYVIEADDKTAGTTRSEEFAAAVAASAAACPGTRIAGVAVSPPQVNVEVPDGTRSLPEGFSGKNVVGGYASGKPMKGKPRTALLGVAAAGAAAAGVGLIKDEPTAISRTVALDVIVLPTVPISLSTGSLFFQVRVNLPVDLDGGGDLRLFLHTGSPDLTPACASVSGHVFQLRQFVPQVVSFVGFTSTGACQPPFTVSLARAVLQDDSGGEKFRTGQAVPDIPFTLHFVQ